MPTKFKGVQFECVYCQETRFHVYSKEGKFHLHCVCCGKLMATAEPRDWPQRMLPVRRKEKGPDRIRQRWPCRFVQCKLGRWPHCGVVSPHGCTPEPAFGPSEES